MSVSPGLADLSRLYQTEFVRSARAVGVLWAVCTLCFAIIQVVILVQPSWIGTSDTKSPQGGPPPPSGTMGLFEVRRPGLSYASRVQLNLETGPDVDVVFLPGHV